MALRLIVTKDGSHSVEAEGGVTYHSTFGAIQESRHIFIGAGLRAVEGSAGLRAVAEGERAPGEVGSGVLRIFEMGFGTGLNALLTLMEMTDRPGGVLVTYCCKGAVRRALEATGFKTEKLPGPPGKSEILRARKPA